MRVAILDPQPMFREALARALAARRRIDVISDCADATAALPLIERLRPDVAIVDVDAGIGDGVTTTRALLQRAPELKVLLLATRWCAEASLDALEAGARGVASKLGALHELLAALDAVAAGAVYVGDGSPRRGAEAGRRRAGADALAGLTPRERDVLRLAIRGRSTRAIAAALSTSQAEVAAWRTSMNRKLALHGPGDLARFAAMHGYAVA